MLRVARLFTPFFLILVLLAVPVEEIRAQESEATDSVPAEQSGDPQVSSGSNESSPYLLDLKIGDSGLDLRWDGYWRMNFVAGGGFGQLKQESIFTDLSRGASFFQQPDVTLTLWMFEKWFIETTFLEGFDRNTYRAGYMGAPGEFVQEVVVGNAGVNATSYAEIDVPAPTFNTPGIVGKFGTDKSEHELLLRFDPTDTQKKFFQGEFEVNTQDIGLPDFIEGKYFILPDTGVSNVRVYLEDRLGDIKGTDGLSVDRYYRLADPVEYFVDNANGLVVLDVEHDGQVLAYYTVGAIEVGTDTIGKNFIVPADANLRPDFDAWAENSANLLDFDWSEDDEYDPNQSGRTYLDTSSVNLDTEVSPALILYNPGRFSPFERQNIYLSSRPLPEETWRIVPLVRDRGSLYPSIVTPEYGFIPDTIEKTISVYGKVGSTDGLRDPGNRYPFAGLDPEVYGPGRETDMDKLSRIMVLAIRELNAGFSLGTGIVPGSVIVRVNGVRDKTVEIGDDGSIEFSRYIYLDDWIEVEYRTETLDLNGGDLFIYQGNHFSLAPRLNLELAESVRWNLSEDRVGEEYEESPGIITVASTLDWETDNAAIRLTGDASLTTPDTAGNLRLFGMDKGTLESVFLTDTLVGPPTSFPGSAPDPLVNIRKTADEYDYVVTGILGGETLNNYMWTGASATAQDKPALAARLSGDEANGRVMELRFDLDDSGDATPEYWTTGDFLADYAGAVNLSGYSTIEFPIKLLEDYGTGTAWPGTWPSGEPRVILQAGEIGEGEDHHDDGVINGIDPGSLVEWDLSTASTEDSSDEAWIDPGNWKTISISLSAAERAKLSSVRAFRILIINESGQSVSGRFIMGAPEFAGSSFRTEIRDISDDLSSTSQSVVGDEVKDNSLLSAYPAVATLFHPNGEDNEALRVRWGSVLNSGTNIALDDRFEAVSWFDGVPLEAYRTLVFYINYSSTLATTTANITDADGKGITLNWLPGVTGWDRITVNIADGTASSDREGLLPALTIDTDAGELSRFVLSGTGQPSGEVFLDEIHFRDPAYAITGGSELQGYWRYEEDVATIGNFPVLGNITVDGRAQVAGGTILSGLDRGNSAVTGSVTLAADILGVGVNTDWRTTWSAGSLEWSGSHNLRIPARQKVFWIEDSYARGETEDDISFSRGNNINLMLGPGSIRLFGDALYDGQSLIQGWGGDTSWQGKNWNAELKIRYLLNTDDAPDSSGDYFSSWARDFRFLIPSEATATNREAHHELKAGLNFGNFALNWEPQLRIKAASAPVWNQENRWAGTLTMPLTFEKWGMTASYRRDMRQVVDPGLRTTGYGDAWSVFSQFAGGSLPLYTFVPFREFLGSQDGDSFEAVTAGMAEADYETELSLNMRRSTGSGIVDLFLPSSGDFSMERKYRRKGDTVGWENEWRGSATFNAVNLFGSFGRYPFLNFYNSEELSSLIQFTLEDYNGLYVPSPGNLIMQTNWAFNGNRNRKFVVDYRVTLDWDPEIRDTSQEGRLEYQWQTASRDRLHIPIFNRVIPRQHHLESKERLTIRGSHPWADAPPSDNLNYGFLIYHETAWVFEDTGHLKGYLAIGLGERDKEFTNGWEIGLEAEFQF